MSITIYSSIEPDVAKTWAEILRQAAGEKIDNNQQAQIQGANGVIGDNRPAAPAPNPAPVVERMRDWKQK